MGSRSGGAPSGSPNLDTISEKFCKRVPPGIYVVKMDTITTI